MTAGLINSELACHERGCRARTIRLLALGSASFHIQDFAIPESDTGIERELLLEHRPPRVISAQIKAITSAH